MRVLTNIVANLLRSPCVMSRGSRPRASITPVESKAPFSLGFLVFLTFQNHKNGKKKKLFRLDHIFYFFFIFCHLMVEYDNYSSNIYRDFLL